MAALRLILCTIIATILFCSLINAAVVHNLIYAAEIENANENGDRVGESYITFPESIRDRRSIHSSDGQSSHVRVCHDTTPCGWAVYIPFSRRVDYFMKNTCNCHLPLKCIRMDDDLSVSAYVYRCRDNITATDIESPDESNSN